MPTYLVNYQAYTEGGELAGDAVIEQSQAIHTREDLDALRGRMRVDLEPAVKFKDGSKLVICNIVNLDKL